MFYGKIEKKTGSSTAQSPILQQNTFALPAAIAAIKHGNAADQSIFKKSASLKTDGLKKIIKITAALAAAACVCCLTAIPFSFALFIISSTGFLLSKRKNILNSLIRLKSQTISIIKNPKKNILKILLIALSLMATCYLGFDLARQLNTFIFNLSQGSYFKNVGGSAALVWSEYILVSGARAAMGISQLKKNKAKAFYHFFNAFLGLALPFARLLNHETIRVHHDLLGLAMQLTPFRALQIFGQLYTLDSALYCIGDLLAIKRYGLDNLLVDHLPAYMNLFLILSSWQLLKASKQPD